MLISFVGFVAYERRRPPVCGSTLPGAVARYSDRMTALDSRPVLRLFTATQAVGAVMLALVALQSHETRLTFGDWPLWGLLAGGCAALWVTVHHTPWTWAVAGAAVSWPMFARGSDLIYNHETFTGRVELRFTLWLVLAVGTVIAWAVVGALAGLDGDDE